MKRCIKRWLFKDCACEPLDDIRLQTIKPKTLVIIMVARRLASLMTPLRNKNFSDKLITFLQLLSWPLKSVNKLVAS